jgi:tetratricopeptide (TPR) repeat protein
MRHFPLLTLCLSLLLSLTSFAQANKDSKVTPQKPPAADQPADYSKEGYVVERMRTVYRFENDGTGRRELSARVKVQSEAGVRDFGQLMFGYNSVNEKIEIPYVRVLKADGTTVTAPADAVQDLSTPMVKEAPMYTDYRQKHVTVPGLRPGEVLEYEVVTILHTPLAADQFWMEHDFAKFGIILSEQLELNIPADRKVKLKTKPGNDPKILDENGRRIYRWNSSNLKREDDNEDSDKTKKKKKDKTEPEPPAVQMTTFSNWDEVGKWYARLEKDRRVPTAEIKAKAAALVDNKKTDQEKIEALYDFVAKNFRYVSLSFGMGRYQPHTAESVLSNQYGDCKDKHTLLASLLEAAGIHASSVLIHSHRKLDPEVPSPMQFDHVITLVPLGKDELWMDTTTEVAPFRLLSFNLRKKQALVIPSEGAAHLEETPADPPMPNLELQSVDGTLTEGGKLAATVKIAGSGDTELVLRSVFRRVPSVNWKKLAHYIGAAGGITGEIDDLNAGDPAETHQPFELTFKVTDKDFIDWTKKTTEIALPLSKITLPESEEDDAPDAEPLKLGPPGEHRFSTKLVLPEKYKVKIPISFAIKRDYGEYEASYKLVGHTLTAERRLVIRERELAAARARDYKAFRNAVLSDVAQQLSLEKTVTGNEIPADLKPDDLNASGYQALQNGNFALALDLLERTVKADPKHKLAWNNLGLVYFSLGKNEEAIAAYQKQIEINPYDEYAYNNLGRVYARQNKNEDAAKAFQKQLEVNPLDKWAHINLGALYIQWKKYDEAVPELEKAASLTPDNPELQVQLGTAYLNLGDEDKAQAAFEKAVDLAPSPPVWNNIAYQLSLKKARLELAQQYAESAVAATAAASRNLSLEHAALRDLSLTAQIANYWDTLGWVHFAKGDLEKAERYVLAAWQLGGHGEVGQHLAEIYEKKGQKALAIETYARSLQATRPTPESREKLAALVGDKQLPAVLSKNTEGLQSLRTVHLGKIAKTTGSADFLLVLGPSGADSLKFISGENNLKAVSNVLRNAKYAVSIPDDTPVKLLRRGTLMCSTTTGNCDFVMLFPEDVRSVE